MPVIKSERLIAWLKMDVPEFAGPTVLPLSSPEPSENNRYSVQCRIGLNPSGDFSPIRFRHHDIEQDQVRLKAWAV